MNTEKISPPRREPSAASRATAGLLRQLDIAFREQGFDDATRHAMLSAIIGRVMAVPTATNKDDQ